MFPFELKRIDLDKGEDSRYPDIKADSDVKYLMVLWEEVWEIVKFNKVPEFKDMPKIEERSRYQNLEF